MLLDCSARQRDNADLYSTKSATTVSLSWLRCQLQIASSGLFNWRDPYPKLNSRKADHSDTSGINGDPGPCELPPSPMVICTG